MSRKRLFIRIAAAFALPAVAVPMLGLWLAVRTPGWYRPPRIAPEDRQIIRDDLSDSAQAFSDALMGDGTFTVRLRARQINNWISMRNEIYPLIERDWPAEWADPFIAFRDGLIRVAATYRHPRTEVILALDVAVAMESDAFILRAVGARIGSIPAPLSRVAPLLAHEIDLPPGRAWRGSPAIRGNLRDGLRVSAWAIWPNGDRAYRVENVTVGRGSLDLAIQPLGATHQARPKRQP